MAEFLLRQPWAVHDVRCSPLGAPIPVRKQLTGEPVAGELHSGFGGRGWRAPFPTPIHRPIPVVQDCRERTFSVRRQLRPPAGIDCTLGCSVLAMSAELDGQRSENSLVSRMASGAFSRALRL